MRVWRVHDVPLTRETRGSKTAVGVTHRRIPRWEAFIDMDVASMAKRREEPQGGGG